MKLYLVGFAILSLLSVSSAFSNCYKYGERYLGVEDKSCTEVKAEMEVAEGNDDIPRCLENGHYDLFQCKGDECFCTDCAGLKIQNYETFARGEYGESQCACAREQDEIDRSGMTGVSHRCDPKGGHYKPYQCQGTGCHCTDQAGKYIPTEDPRARFQLWTAEGKDEFCGSLQ